MSSPVIFYVWKDCKAYSTVLYSFFSKVIFRIIPEWKPMKISFSFGVVAKLVILALNYFKGNFLSLLT
jgi:hypothetical protein